MNMNGTADTADGTVAGAGLADVISQVRAELEEAQRRGSASGMRFRVQKVHLEFAVQVRREGSGKGGLRIGVVTAELGATASKDTTHRIQVELEPRGPGGEGPLDMGGPGRGEED